MCVTQSTLEQKYYHPQRDRTLQHSVWKSAGCWGLLWTLNFTPCITCRIYFYGHVQLNYCVYHLLRDSTKSTLCLCPREVCACRAWFASFMLGSIMTHFLFVKSTVVFYVLMPPACCHVVLHAGFTISFQKLLFVCLFVWAPPNCSSPSQTKQPIVDGCCLTAAWVGSLYLFQSTLLTIPVTHQVLP